MAENHKDIEIAAGGAPTAPYDALSPRKSVTKGVRSLKELPDQAAIERVYQYVAGLK